jgi:TolA-binding protein
MDRTKGILAAGTFTGLVLITILVLGFGNLQAKSVEDTAVPISAEEISPPPTDGIELEQALQEWQTYSAELEQTVRTLQDRETAYQQQLDAANQTIVQLQNEINQANNALVTSFSEEHESDEDESREHESFEHESHEHEFEEFDD